MKEKIKQLLEAVKQRTERRKNEVHLIREEYAAMLELLRRGTISQFLREFLEFARVLSAVKSSEQVFSLMTVDRTNPKKVQSGAWFLTHAVLRVVPGECIMHVYARAGEPKKISVRFSSRDGGITVDEGKPISESDVCAAIEFLDELTQSDCDADTAYERAKAYAERSLPVLPLQLTHLLLEETESILDELRAASDAIIAKVANSQE